MPTAPARTLWYAGCVGIVGAFFSVAIAVRDRTLETDRVTLDTTLDAALRMFVGALGGALLLGLIQSGAVGLIIGGARIIRSDTDTSILSLSTGWLPIMLVAFVGGFFERMVPDLLNKATTVDGPGQSQASTRRATAAAETNERNPLGRPQAPGDEPTTTNGTNDTSASKVSDPVDEDADDCCDHDTHLAADTEDVELPEAIGGVEADIKSPADTEGGR